MNLERVLFFTMAFLAVVLVTTVTTVRVIEGARVEAERAGR